MRRSLVRAWLPLCLLCLLLAALFSLVSGTLDLSPAQVLRLLLAPKGTAVEQVVLWQVRLPRLLLAGLVGASLALSGSVFQAVLRNPLADPYLLGISGGAALGAVLALVLKLRFFAALPLAAFVGALAALALVYLVAQAQQASGPTLILAGVMVGSLATAVLLFLLWLIPADPLRSAVFWLAGNLAHAPPGWLLWAATGCALCGLYLWRQAPLLDLFTQGEDVAADLGVDVGLARLQLFCAAGLLVATAVALAGLVGFVGLVVPHAARLLWGPAHRRLLPAAALLGAAFLILADAVARSLLAPAEVPVGVFTALIGAPLFLYLLRWRGQA
ncbi:MAG: iron ABC transporter permease [Desulfuromonas thiophila]|nr:iron ABC transporter permease [Desulfuromonas thiophila]